MSRTGQRTMTERRQLYLRRLFAASPGGITARDLALEVGERIDEVEALLEQLWRDQRISRMPNPRARGFVWRTKLRGDGDAGFLFELEGEPLRMLGGQPSRQVGPRELARKVLRDD